MTAAAVPGPPVPLVEPGPELTAAERARAVLLVDVRTAAEREVPVVPGAVPVPLEEVLAGGVDLPAGRRVVLHCRSGARSERAVRVLRAAGHPDAAHPEGGILAWAAQVDPGPPA